MASRLLLALVLAAHAAASAFAADDGLCRAAVSATERSSGVPDRLMQAIAVIESGRRSPSGVVAPWPWTINVEGVGEVFDTKQQAIAAVSAHRARGARSIDIGCMQVNMLHHPDAFASLDEAFDPVANTRYAARFLQQLLAQTGSWPRAVAGYHSLTPEVGDGYARKVLAVWAQPEPRRQPAPAVPKTGPPPQATLATISPPAALPAGLPARLLPMPGSGGPALTGRGLDSYRSMPTPMLTAGLVRRP